LFLYHVINGLGFPLATHNKVLVFPSSMVMGPDSRSVICGATI